MCLYGMRSSAYFCDSFYMLSNLYFLHRRFTGFLKMDFDLQPFLENDLVSLRPLSQADFKALYIVASDPLLWEQHQNQDRYTKENFTKFFNEGIISKGALVITDVKTNKIIGSSRFKSIEEGVIEIGWSFLDRDFWGGKYNRVFKQLMINYALQYCKHVVFYVNNKNFRSQRAMEKLGAKKMIFSEKAWVLREDVGLTYTIDYPLKD